MKATDGMSALHWAAARRDQTTLRIFCANTKYKDRNISSCINLADKKGYTPLMLVCQNQIDNFLSVEEQKIENEKYRQHKISMMQNNIRESKVACNDSTL